MNTPTQTKQTNHNQRPSQTDCFSHHIRQEGEFPRTQFIAVFQYEDGSEREYDGREWKLTAPAYLEN